jgi:hypothetical protein
MSDGGKGSKQRPTDKAKFDEGWDRIFGNKTKKIPKKVKSGKKQKE